eukprot:267142_1
MSVTTSTASASTTSNIHIKSLDTDRHCLPEEKDIEEDSYVRQQVAPPKEAADEPVVDSVKTIESFSIGGVDEESDIDDLESPEYRVEFEEALAVVRDVAKVDQELLVNAICNIYNDLCDEEPDAPQLSEIFREIKATFAEEATAQCDEPEGDESSEDSDYDQSSEGETDSEEYNWSQSEASESDIFDASDDDDESVIADAFNIGGVDEDDAPFDIQEELELEEALDLVDSDEFRKEFDEALQIVRDVAKVDQELLVNGICNIYNDLCDEEPDAKQLSLIFDAVKDGLAEEATQELEDLEEENESDSDYDVADDDISSEEEEEETDDEEEEEEKLESDIFNQEIDIKSEQFRKEFEEALQVTRDVAKLDQELLVNGICNFYNDLCDEEPDVKQLSEIFGAVKEELAEEATKQFVVGLDEEEDADSDYDVAEDELMETDSEEYDWSETEEDSDYDPKEDEEQGIKDAEEDLFDESSSEAESEEEKGLEDEEELIKSEAFETEWNSAFDNIRKVAQKDRETILENVRWQFEEETGEEATEDVMQDAFQTFYGSDLDEDVEDDLCDVDSHEFRTEFEEALQVARDMAKIDQVRLVNTICNISSNLCDREPDVDQISQIFDRIKDAFAEEAREEFLDLYETSADKDDSDSDYDVTEDLDDCEDSEAEEVIELFNIDYSSEEEVCDVDSQEFRKEFDEALQIVRDVARVDQELLVNGICNMYNDLRLEEPDVQQLSHIFGAVKAELADEARAQFDEDKEDKESDSDYDVDNDAFDYSQDVEDDKFESDEDQEEEEDEI